MGYFSAFVDTVLSYWWLVISIVAFAYIYSFSKNLKKIIKDKKEEDEKYEKVITQERKNLGISIAKGDHKKYMARIDDLIHNLNSTEDTISVKPVEAILLSELYSESIKINEKGELLLTRDTATKFANFIYNNPSEFLKYVKSIETKIDQTNKENKIKLGDLLFMMRNARKFGLSINKEAGENDYKIKAAIHEKDFQDAVINFVPEEKIVDETYMFNVGNASVKNAYMQKEEEQLHDAEENSEVEKVTKLDNGRVLIIMKNGTRIEKDDFNIYNVENPEEEEKNNKNNVTNHPVNFNKKL